jgi:hypothetical protein
MMTSTYAESTPDSQPFALYPREIGFLAAVLKAVSETARVGILQRGGDSSIEGVARHVVEPDSEGIAFLWTHNSRLRITTNGGWEIFVPLRDIKAIEVLS